MPTCRHLICACRCGRFTRSPGSVDRFPFRRLKPEEPLALDTTVTWAGIKDKYFLAVMIAGEEHPFRGGSVVKQPDTTVVLDSTQVVMPQAIVTTDLPVAADGKFSYSAYLGPQDYRRLGSVGMDLEEATPYGYRWLQPVIRPLIVLAAREAEGDQRVVQQVARIIAGEGASGAVCAAQPWRQAHDQEPGIDRAERMDRRIEPVRLLGAPLLAERDKTRTERTVPRRLAICCIAHDLARRTAAHVGGPCAPPYSSSKSSSAAPARCGAGVRWRNCGVWPRSPR